MDWPLADELSDRIIDLVNERLEESNDAFQEAMAAAIRAHHATLVIVADLLRAVGDHEAELDESLDELKRLLLERRNGHDTPPSEEC